VTEQLESRTFQCFQVAFPSGRLRKKMFGNFKCRRRLALIELPIAKHLVQGASQDGNRRWFVPHAGPISGALNIQMTTAKILAVRAVK